MLSRICRSIERQFKRSVDTLIVNHRLKLGKQFQVYGIYERHKIYTSWPAETSHKWYFFDKMSNCTVTKPVVMASFFHWHLQTGLIST